MRLLRRAAPVALGDLVHRAREGDAVALAVLRADLPSRTVAALRRLVPATDGSALAVVTAARAPGIDPGPLVDLLMEGDVRTTAAVGELLGLPEQDVLTMARRRPACRGWSLLTGTEALTEQERIAGRAHAARCRPCSAALDGERVPLPRLPDDALAARTAAGSRGA